MNVMFPLSQAKMPGPSPPHANCGYVGVERALKASVEKKEIITTAATFPVVRYSKSKLPAMALRLHSKLNDLDGIC
jgi:hypothetical protein